jgi:hypothetical protein
VKPATETLLLIAGGSILGLWAIEKYFGSESFAAKQNMKMMKMMDMKMMDAVAAVDIPKCTCQDGMQVMAMKVMGMKDMFTCPCEAHEVTGVASGVTLVPQSQGVRANQLQTVPNAVMKSALMPVPGAGAGAQMPERGLLPGGSSQSGALAAMDETDAVSMALMNSGVGDAEKKKLMMALKKQGMMKMSKATCTCPDGTKVMDANGICNCGAVATGGAVGLNRNIAAVPMQKRMKQMAQAQPMQQRQMRGLGGVSPTNTGQVCVLDPVSNNFILSGTNPPVMCDPGAGITEAKGKAQMMGLEQARNPLDTFSTVAPATLYAKAYLAPSSMDGERSLPLIPMDDEDLYEEVGNLRDAYPNTHVQDLVSQYDEDSHTLPFFITEPESYRAVSAPIANYPRK